MLEDIVEHFTDRLKNVVLTDERMKSIPLAYLMRLDIPDSIKHFFDQEVELWIREEEEKFTSDERFDYDMPEVRMLIDQMFDILKQNATFNIAKFSYLLERAVKLEMNYLIEPHRTLSQFLFKDSPKIPTREVYDTFKYFFKFDYYKTAISDYFNQKYLQEISQDQFEDLMNQIDNKAFAENKIETTLSTIKTIMEFLSEAQEMTVNSLTTDLLYSAFRDRGLEDYLQQLEKAKKQGLSELKFDDVERLLREGILPGEAKEISEETQILGFEKTESLEKTQPTVSVADFKVSESQIVLEEEEPETEVEEEVFEEEEEKPLEEAMEEKAAPSRVADDLADHVARQISSEEPLEDLNSMVTGRTRRKIIKKLFKKNENEFLSFIERLNNLTTWKEASRSIDDEFYNRGINPYSKEAISFSDIIYVRFFPKDKYVGHEDEMDKF